MSRRVSSFATQLPTFRDEVIDTATPLSVTRIPVLHCGVFHLGVFLHHNLDNGGMKLVFVAHRSGATFEIRDVTTVVADNEGALKLSRVSRVDAEIGGEFHRTANTARNINEGTVGEDGTVERSEIIVAIGNDRAKVFAHEFRIFSHGLTDGAEDDALFLQFLLEGGFDRHGVHHGINGHTRECQTLMKRDAEFVEGFHQFGVYLFAAFLLLFLGRVGIIRDGLIVDLWQVDVSPFGLLQCEPIAIGLQAEVEQPFWFAFLRGDETNDIFIEASLDDFRMDIGGEAVFVFLSATSRTS